MGEKPTKNTLKGFNGATRQPKTANDVTPPAPWIIKYHPLLKPHLKN